MRKAQRLVDRQPAAVARRLPVSWRFVPARGLRQHSRTGYTIWRGPSIVSRRSTTPVPFERSPGNIDAAVKVDHGMILSRDQ